MALGEYRPAGSEPAIIPAHKRVREILDQYDPKSEKGRIAVHNIAYIAGLNHEIDVLWASEGTPHHPIVKEGFEAGKANFHNLHRR